MPAAPIYRPGERHDGPLANNEDYLFKYHILIGLAGATLQPGAFFPKRLKKCAEKRRNAHRMR